MSRSNIDLDELQRFRNTLDRVNREMAGVRKSLVKSVDESNVYWKDQQRQLFLAKFSVFKLPMEKFELKARDYIDWADRKRAAGRQYLHGGR